MHPKKTRIGKQTILIFFKIKLLFKQSRIKNAREN